VIFAEGLAKVAEQSGLAGLPRGPTADPQVAGPVRHGPLFHRGGAAELRGNSSWSTGADAGPDHAPDRSEAYRTASGRTASARQRPASGPAAWSFTDEMNDEIQFYCRQKTRHQETAREGTMAKRKKKPRPGPPPRRLGIQAALSVGQRVVCVDATPTT